MKKIIVSAFVLAVATMSVRAQDIPERKQDMHQHKSGEHKRHHRGEAFKQLGLSEDQKAKFKALNEDFRTQIQALKKDDGITVKEWKSKKETLKKEHRAKVEALLTTEQKAKMQKMKEDRKSVRKVDQQARMEKMKIRLGLSDDQVAKLSKSRTELDEKMKALRENKSLTDDQRKEQFKELRKKQKENFKSILTEEQLKKLHDKQHRSAKQPV
jgi:Spy/CpxP family protein refolding chaperone